MAEIICIGSAVIDISAQPVGDSRNWKEKQRISGIQIQPGGDAVNQSLRLADLGKDVALAACIGDDQNGVILKSVLQERNVKTKYLTKREGISTGTALVLIDEKGERHTFSVFGAHSTLAKTELTDHLLTPEVKAISLASLFSMPEAEADGMEEFLRHVKQERGSTVRVFADLASDKKKQGLNGIRRFLPYIDYFLPSLYDALEITGTKDASSAAEIFHECGVKHVIIKCGENGCYYSIRENSGAEKLSRTEGMIPAVHVKPVDTTGAGDCMVALFISQILEGKSLAEACTFACAGASYSTLFMGASAHPITEADIYAFAKNSK